MLGVLALEAGRTVATTDLASWCIGHPAPPNAHDRVHVLVSRVRRELAGCGRNVALASTPGGYRLDVAAASLDAAQFEALLADASHAPEVRVAALRDALALWRGEVLDGLGLDGHPAAVRLSAARDDALDEQFSLGVDGGGFLPLLPAALQRSLDRPDREALAGDVMRALYRAGRQRDAIAHFHRTRAALREQFGLEPSHQLARVEQAILRHDTTVLGSSPRIRVAVDRRTTPAATPLSIETSLPPPPGPFIGRERELTELEEALTVHRLVTLWGPGGVGKTSLALRMAATLSTTVPVWFVDLSTVTQEADVAHTVSRQLALDPDPRAQVDTVVARQVAAAGGVLVLDNCEHVLTTAARLAERVAAAGEGARVVATSRQPLDVPAEYALPVGPMIADDQVALLRSCLPASSSTSVDEGDLMAHLCDALDGLPLAITLAGARLRTMTLSELAGRLDERLALLGSAHAGVSRHSSLGALLAWSYELLTSEEQRLFSQLWVFVGSFDADAAADVCVGCGARAAVGKLLTSLAEKSLVHVVGHDDPTRYRMLETVRHYAARLSRDPTTVERHAHHYSARLAGLTAQHRPAHQVADAIDAELANVREAFQFLLDDGDFVRAGRSVANLTTYAELRPSMEVLDWANTFLHRSQNGPATHDTIRAHLVAGVICNYIAAWHESERHYQRAYELDQQLNAGHAFAALVGLASPVAFLGRPAEAFEWATKAVSEAARAGSAVQLAVGRCVQSWGSLFAQRAHDLDLNELELHIATASTPIIRAYALSAYACQLFGRRHASAGDALLAAAEAADRIGHRHMRCLHRSFLPFARNDGDHAAGQLNGVRTSLRLYGEARLPFGPRQVVAEAYSAFEHHQRWHTIAVLSGAAIPRSIFAIDAQHAKRLARQQLGDDAYNRAADIGRQLDHDAFAAYLTNELDHLDVPKTSQG